MDGDNAPENGSFVIYFIHYSPKRSKEGYMKFIVGGLGRQKKAKQGSLCNYKMKRQILLLHW